MHPILDKDRFSPCEELIDQLEDCHKSQFFETMFGKCSEIKTQLANCLHEARLANDREQILKRREKNKILESKKKIRDEEEWGENGYLKKVLEHELMLKKQQQQQQNQQHQDK